MCKIEKKKIIKFNWHISHNDNKWSLALTFLKCQKFAGLNSLSATVDKGKFNSCIYRVSQLRLSSLISRLFMKFKIRIFWTVKVQLVIIKLPQVKKCNSNTCFRY
jgi:hypothetical protein